MQFLKLELLLSDDLKLSIDDEIQVLTDSLSEIKDIQLDIDYNDTHIFINILKPNINSLKDLSIEWKIIKEFWLKFNLFNNSNYLSFFKLLEYSEKVDSSKSNIDNLIYKVPENDTKVLDILSQIKIKWKKN